MKKATLLSVFMLIQALNFAQNAIPWNRKKCAVALTYDDALDGHLTNVVTILDSAGLKSTFSLAIFPVLSATQTVRKPGPTKPMS